MKEINEYADFINKKLKSFKESNKHRSRIINTEHDDVINDFDVGIFKIETITFFKECFSTKMCECGCKAKEIFYGKVDNILTPKKFRYVNSMPTNLQGKLIKSELIGLFK
mgnify:CR=1 FL=1